MKYLFISLRPHHWIKNFFVFAALIFAEKFFDWQAWQASLAAFVVFCLASSGVYLINDVIDYKSDREHPIKKNRPLARGIMSRSAAVFWSGFFLLFSLIGGWFINLYLAVIVAAYILLNIFYSLFLKKIVILDVIIIALGFVLRVIAGAVAIQVAFSVWLLLCTFFLALFLAIGKRKSELLHAGAFSRGVLQEYSTELLGLMNAVVAPAALITYTFYTFNTWQSQWLFLTIPVVLYGLLRYLFIIEKKSISDDGPVNDLLTDRPLQIAVFAWIVLVLVVLTL